MRGNSLLQIVILVAAVLLAACSSTPQARFYTLAPLAPPEAKKLNTNSLVINVAPVEIPEYLDRPQIVTKNGRNGLQLAEFDRWAGSLGDDISGVLAEDLSLLLGTDRVFVNSSEKADYSVAMRVLRLDSLPGDQVFLKAQWTISSGQGGKDRVTRVSSVSEKLADSRYETVVAAINRAVERVSREIAGEISGGGKAAPGERSRPAR